MILTEALPQYLPYLAGLDGSIGKLKQRTFTHCAAWCTAQSTVHHVYSTYCTVDLHQQYIPSEPNRTASQSKLSETRQGRAHDYHSVLTSTDQPTRSFLTGGWRMRNRPIEKSKKKVHRRSLTDSTDDAIRDGVRKWIFPPHPQIRLVIIALDMLTRGKNSHPYLKFSMALRRPFGKTGQGFFCFLLPCPGGQLMPTHELRCNIYFFSHGGEGRGGNELCFLFLSRRFNLPMRRIVLDQFLDSSPMAWAGAWHNYIIQV